MFPSAKADEEGRADEERRLFYVVVTRAKDHLYLFSPSVRKMSDGGMFPVDPSVFVKEIPPELVVTKRVMGDWSGGAYGAYGAHGSYGTGGGYGGYRKPVTKTVQYNCEVKATMMPISRLFFHFFMGSLLVLSSNINDTLVGLKSQ